MDRCQIILLIVSLLWICTNTVSSSNDKTDRPPRSILELKAYHEVIENLEERGILTKDQAKREKQLYIEYESKLIEKDKLLATKESLVYEKQASIVSFSNIIAVLAGFIIFIAGSIFILVYILPNLSDIPVETWEILLYFFAFLLMFWCKNSWLVFLGCLVLFSTLNVSFYLGRFGQGTGIVLTESFILFISWSIAAIYQQNREVGYLAIAALEIFSSLYIKKGELPASFGFTRHSLTFSVTISSFFLMVTGSFLHLIPVNSLTIPFTRPLLLIGTLVYFIGLPILSYEIKNQRDIHKDVYALLQVITFLSGLSSILFGPMFAIPFLQGMEEQHLSYGY